MNVYGVVTSVVIIMGSLYKRKQSENYYYKYRDALGDLSYKSTGTSSKRAALRIVAEWENEVARTQQSQAQLPYELSEVVRQASRDAVNGTLTLDRARDYITELYRLGGGNSFPEYTVQSWLQQWLEHTRPHISESTISRYSTSVCDLQKALGAASRKRLDLLSTEDVRSAQKKLANGNRKASTVNFKLQDLRTALNAAVEQGLVKRNVAKAVKPLPTEDSDIRVPFEKNEVQQLLSVADNDWHGMILFGALTGLRLSNIARLQWRDVHLDRGTVTLKPVKQRKGKRKVITVPLAPVLVSALKSRPGRRNGPVFPVLARASSSKNSQDFRRIMSSANVPREIEIDGGDKGTRSFHSLRHFFISSLANAQIGEDVRMTLAAHSSSDVHQLYAKHSADTLREAISVLPDFKADAA